MQEEEEASSTESCNKSQPLGTYTAVETPEAGAPVPTTSGSKRQNCLLVNCGFQRAQTAHVKKSLLHNEFLLMDSKTLVALY